MHQDTQTNSPFQSPEISKDLIALVFHLAVDAVDGDVLDEGLQSTAVILHAGTCAESKTAARRLSHFNEALRSDGFSCTVVESGNLPKKHQMFLMLVLSEKRHEVVELVLCSTNLKQHNPQTQLEWSAAVFPIQINIQRTVTHLQGIFLPI